MNISAWEQKHAHIFDQLPVVYEDEDPLSSDASQITPTPQHENQKNDQINEQID